ncbi:glutaminase [Chryseomicrobium aureum]|uniref:glutaminase A n=1 Tax=Chryseomicrobium aureum TaxID=1441723 RepID=UPI00195E0DB3|nr:glutaminase A [Chryseomicrobium aureum]MBM7705864.1 glutaminase [Chryseomicrobium aureum]
MTLKEYEKQLEELFIDCERNCENNGKVASYIPALERVDPDIFAVSIMDTQGRSISSGDIDFKFTMQSISKVVIFLYALENYGEEAVFERITLDPTGDPFNTIMGIQSTSEGNVHNPMINSGAIVLSSMIAEKEGPEALRNMLEFTRTLTGDDGIYVDVEVFDSEKSTALRNKAIAYFLQASGSIHDTEDSLDLYFQMCSIAVTVEDIARMGALLANKGIDPFSNERILQDANVKTANAYMLLSGMYDASSRFTIKVGFPAKSGVSGSILAVVSDRMGIGILSPPLDSRGNSVKGIQLLKKLSEQWDLSVF